MTNTGLFQLVCLELFYFALCSCNNYVLCFTLREGDENATKGRIREIRQTFNGEPEAGKF